MVLGSYGVVLGCYMVLWGDIGCYGVLLGGCGAIWGVPCGAMLCHGDAIGRHVVATSVLQGAMLVPCRCQVVPHGAMLVPRGCHRTTCSSTRCHAGAIRCPVVPHCATLCHRGAIGCHVVLRGAISALQDAMLVPCWCHVGAMLVP